MGCACCLPMSFLKARTSKMTCNSEMICITTKRKILAGTGSEGREVVSVVSGGW